MIYNILESNVLDFILKLSIKGLVLYLIVVVALSYMKRILRAKHCKKAIKVMRKLRLSKKMHMRIRCVLVFLIMISILLKIFSALIVHDEEKYVYRQTELASQMETNILFSQEPNKDDSWKKSESISQLHIKNGFAKEEISQEMFDYYEELFSEICKGDKEIGLNGIRYQSGETKGYFSIDNKYIQEAEKWKKLYDSKGTAACLYQYGRALNDAAMTLSGMSFTDMQEIAADSISIEEEFLSYSDRNININEDTPIIINTEDVSLMNGKLYMRLAVCAGAGNEEEKGYANCLLVEAYKCIEQGKLQINRQNDLYALLAYYQGVIGEKMLRKISKEDDLYNIIGRKALENYQISLNLVEENSDFYKKEANMKKKLNSGISTLKEVLK